MSVDVLFRPFEFKSLKLRNRTVMAPMTRSFSPDGIVTGEVAAYYARRAAGEVGLIISEGTGIERPASLNGDRIPRFHGERELTGWRGVVEAVHAEGGAMAPQIWHVGAVPSPYGTGPSADLHEGPSGLHKPDTPHGRAMTDADIADAIAGYAKGAAEAERLGFDAVELHGAHGYLIDQFFWGGTNRRDDAWNGSTIGARSRFAREALQAVRRAVSDKFTVILRVSQWKQQDYTARLATTPDELTAWLGPLVDAGADILHCSQRRFWEPEFPELDGEDGLNFAGWAKKLTGVPTISVGSVGLSNDFFHSFAGRGAEKDGLEKLIARMEREEFDLIAIGRALLADPRWVTKIREGQADQIEDFRAERMAELV